MYYERETRLQFEMIASLWREREGRAFVSREELHSELARVSQFDEIPDNDENAFILECAHRGIDLELDRFAIVGPDYESWKAMGEDEYFCPKFPYFRYLVTRTGVEGYVPLGELEPWEAEEIAAKLRAEAEEAEREVKALVEWGKAGIKTGRFKPRPKN